MRTRLEATPKKYHGLLRISPQIWQFVMYSGQDIAFEHMEYSHTASEFSQQCAVPQTQ